MRARGVALVALLALGCATATDTPGGTVKAYFRLVGRDPLRTLALLAPGFHAAHDLHVVTTAEARAFVRGRPRTPAPPVDSAAIQLAPDRLALAWLAIQGRPGYLEHFGALRVEPVDEQIEGDRAQVSVRVEAQGAPPFEQRFSLVRERGVWRIDAVEQSDVTDANRLDAFVAFPNEAARSALERQATPGARGAPRP